MALYKKSGNNLKQITQKNIKLEKQIQKLTEDNLDEVFGLNLVATEFQLNNLRIDTLAYDEESKSFIIIEYKKDRSFSVVDQGYAYLALLLNNKADFILEYNQKFATNLGKDDIDWSQSKIIFIAQSFTKYQQEAIGFQDIPIELWEVKMYENGLVSFSDIQPSEKSESIKVIEKGQKINDVTKEIKSYSISDHIKADWDDTKALFDQFSEEALEMDSRISMNPKKHYIGFNIDRTVLFHIKPRKSKLLLQLYRVEPSDLNDPEKRTKYSHRSYEYYHKHITDFEILNEDDVAYAIMLAKQILKKFDNK